MNEEECYRVLRLPFGSSFADVKHSFRKLAMQYSPDHHPDDEVSLAKYREVVTAYRTLGEMRDPRRRVVDAARDGPKVRSFKSFDDLFDAYEEPSDVRCEVRISRREARRGCERMLTIERFRVCPECHGRTGDSPCRSCGGSGKIWEKVDVKLRIPPEIQNGALLRLPHEGDLKHEQGQREDVYCRVVIE